MRLPLLVSIGLGACSVGEVPLVAPADQPLPAELHEGDLITLGDLALVVPAPDESVGISAHLDDGTTFELTVANEGGQIVATVPPHATIDSLAVAQNACSDGAYTLEGFHWDRELRWSFQAGSTPAGNSVTHVAAGLVVAANAITSAHNNCGLADQVSATNHYDGTTTRGTNIPNSTTQVTCGTRDDVNVVGFGTLPTNYLAVTCSWWSSTKIALEADLKFNKHHAWFSQAVPAGCSNRYGIEQVGTHEFGHAFGLGHVGQAAHGNQTMSPISDPCTNAKVTLGLGDVRGLRALY